MTSIKEFTQPKENGTRNVVVMLIHNKQGETLFTRRATKRKFLPGVWALPAGHIESSENFQQTTVREANEELQIDVHAVNLIETIDEPGGDNTRVFLVDILHTDYSGIPQLANDEASEIRWFQIDEFYNQFSDQEIGSTLRHLRPKFQK